VERGVLTLYVADADGEIRRRVAGAGEVVAIPAGREHTIRNECGEEARALAVFAPGAPMEAFIRAAAAMTEPDMQAALALAAEHGIEMTRELATA
jgi:oxalate decarboxylase/phosphoglucose isomerase-like protein (cupin superfamily)